LAKHRNIDAGRIAVIGFSRGGQSSTYSSLERFRKSHGSPDVQVAAHINVYANCGWSLQDDDQVMKPMLFLHGSADDRALPKRAGMSALSNIRMRSMRMTRRHSRRL